MGSRQLSNQQEPVLTRRMPRLQQCKICIFECRRYTRLLPTALVRLSVRAAPNSRTHTCLLCGVHLQVKDKGVERRAVLNAEASKNRKMQPQEYRSQITKPSHLSKQTAGEINMLHNTVTAQNQIKATETITEASEGHRCALEWKWKSNDGRMHSVRMVKR